MRFLHALMILLLLSNLILLPKIISTEQVDTDEIIIAIIDTGVDYNHPALGGGIGPDKIIIGGYDFIDNDDDPMDELGHGTHIAGIITNISPNSKILAYRVVDYTGLVKSSDVINAMELAVSNGADVINLSLGSLSESEELRKSIKQISNSGVIIVTAVGNSGPIFGSIGDPGKYEDVISVGSHYNSASNSTLAIIQIDAIKEELIGLPLVDSVLPNDVLHAELEFVNYARSIDLDGIDLTGKIAVAKRRGAEPSEVVYFSTKEANVAKKGAIGLIVINTVPGIIKGRLMHPNIPVGYSPSIPTLLITQEDGEKLIKQIFDSQTFVKLDFNPKNLTNFVSIFSSRGPVSSFYMKPDLVSFGEQINSTWLGNSYKLQNGTSFSAPYVTATVALLLNHHGELNHSQILGIISPSATPLKNLYGVYWPSTLQGSGSLNIDKALHNPISIIPSHLSFNLAETQSVNTQIITIQSLVSDTLEISITDIQTDNSVDMTFNSSNIILEGRQSKVIEVQSRLINSIEESFTDEFRLTFMINQSNIELFIPVLIYYNTVSLSIDKKSNLVNLQGIDNYDQILLQIYNTDTGVIDRKIFASGEEIQLNLSPGNYWIDAIVSHSDNNFSYGGIEYHVDFPAVISIPESNSTNLSILVSFICLFCGISLLFLNKKP